MIIRNYLQHGSNQEELETELLRLMSAVLWVHIEIDNEADGRRHIVFHKNYLAPSIRINQNGNHYSTIMIRDRMPRGVFQIVYNYFNHFRITKFLYFILKTCSWGILHNFVEVVVAFIFLLSMVYLIRVSSHQGSLKLKLKKQVGQTRRV